MGAPTWHVAGAGDGRDALRAAQKLSRTRRGSHDRKAQVKCLAGWMAGRTKGARVCLSWVSPLSQSTQGRMEAEPGGLTLPEGGGTGCQAKHDGARGSLREAEPKAL